MNGRVIVLGGRANLVEAAYAADVSVVWLHQPGTFGERARRICERTLEIDLADVATVERTVETLYAEREFDAVLSLTEECLLTAARLNERLGLGGNSVETVTLLKDKVLMRQRLAQAGLSPVAARVVNDLDALREFMAEVGGPVVLKPSTGAGSVQVFRLETPRQAEDAWRRVAAAGPLPVLLAEEFLSGREISVEAFSHNAVHTVVATTDKTLTETYVEVGHTVPAVLGEGTLAEVTALVTAFLDVLGLLQGPSHTEVKLTPTGPRIVESHDRIGGGSLNDLVRLACGVDLARLTLTVPLGLEPVPQPPFANRGAAVRFLQAPPGVVRSVLGVERAAAVEGSQLHAVAAVGAVVPPMRSSYDRVNGYVIASGRDASEAVRRCEQVLRTVRIDTGPLASLN